MANIKSYREIKKVVAAEAAWARRHEHRKYERHEIDSLAELRAAEAVRDFYADKMRDSADAYAEANTKAELLKEKIRSAGSARESYGYTAQLIELEDSLLDFKDDADDFAEAHKKLNELCSIAERLREKCRYWEVVKIIPERKLVELVRDDDGFDDFCDLVDKVLEDLRAAAREKHENREKRRKEREHRRNMHIEHTALTDVDKDAAIARKNSEVMAEKQAEDAALAADSAKNPNKA
jgi:hypothetical protein